eukprot:scaffold81991_cov72-Phaeocystis_antarctica.AAC.4
MALTGLPVVISQMAKVAKASMAIRPLSISASCSSNFSVAGRSRAMFRGSKPRSPATLSGDHSLKARPVPDRLLMSRSSAAENTTSAKASAGATSGEKMPPFMPFGDMPLVSRSRHSRRLQMRGWRYSCAGRAMAASIASLACFSSAWRSGVIVSGCENSGSANPLLPTATARTKNPRPLKSEVIVGGGARGTTAVGSVTKESMCRVNASSGLAGTFGDPSSKSTW